MRPRYSLSKGTILGHANTSFQFELDVDRVHLIIGRFCSVPLLFWHPRNRTIPPGLTVHSFTTPQKESFPSLFPLVP